MRIDANPWPAREMRGVNVTGIRREATRWILGREAALDRVTAPNDVLLGEGQWLAGSQRNTRSVPSASPLSGGKAGAGGASGGLETDRSTHIWVIRTLRENGIWVTSMRPGDCRQRT